MIWQVGTNAVLRRDDLSADEQLISRGVALMKESGIDVVLMDLQYAPRVLARPASAEMERLIAEIARRTQVGLFRRFEIMQEWDRTQQLAPACDDRPRRAAYDRRELCLSGEPAGRGSGVELAVARQAGEIASTQSGRDRRRQAPGGRAARRVLGGRS